ncbi:MAG TPA: 2-dehydropantoate 2-reductase [Terriglobales bacterium]|jgi:2-dehydropantoate 2-reductase|nr:2-dehydropantoate 2-reductase [Terriglobales bacterium]
MRHAILGPGGVGGLIGACLAKNGAPVTMVVRSEALDNYPRQLQLESAFGNFTVDVEKSAQVPPVDVLWITVKATQLDAALRSIPAVDSARAIVPLLNGTDHVPLLRSRYGAERVLPATIAVETERVAPGHIVHRSPFARLHLTSQARGLLGATIEQFQQMGFICQWIDNEATLLWSKLALLAPLALTTSAAGAPKGDVAASPHWRAQLESCVREACAVAKAEGARVDPDVGLKALMGLPDGMRSSMQKDIEQGNPPELDAIAGPILRGGERHGIPVPVTRGLVTIVEGKARIKA